MVSGLIGSILFFPLRMEANYTCLFHRYFNGEQPMQSDTDKTFINTGLKTAGAMKHQKLLHHYMHNYVFFWWVSIALAALSFWKLKRSDTKTSPGLKTAGLKNHSIIQL